GECAAEHVAVHHVGAVDDDDDAQRGRGDHRAKIRDGIANAMKQRKTRRRRLRCNGHYVLFPCPSRPSSRGGRGAERPRPLRVSRCAPSPAAASSAFQASAVFGLAPSPLSPTGLTASNSAFFWSAGTSTMVTPASRHSLSVLASKAIALSVPQRASSWPVSTTIFLRSAGNPLSQLWLSHMPVMTMPVCSFTTNFAVL